MNLQSLIEKICGHKKDNYTFVDTGFHGDRYVQELVAYVIQTCDYFIETGTHVGSTLSYVARVYPNVTCLSCEPDKKAFHIARSNVNAYPNVELYNMHSMDFLHSIAVEKEYIFDKKVLFWLDAHGYGFKWPLKNEIQFITHQCKSMYILIDDFKVPGFDCFGYDTYKKEVCSFDYIRDSFCIATFDLYYPCYQDRTSVHHPLRGWGLFVINADFIIPDSLKSKMSKYLPRRV